MVRFLTLLVELLTSLGVPYGIVWVGGWFGATAYLNFRKQQYLIAIAAAAFALGFVLMCSAFLELFPTYLAVESTGLFLLEQLAASVLIGGILLWLRWVILQRRTKEHVRLYAPLYLFPLFVLGVLPYAWLVSMSGHRITRFIDWY